MIEICSNMQRVKGVGWKGRKGNNCSLLRQQGDYLGLQIFANDEKYFSAVAGLTITRRGGGCTAVCEIIFEKVAAYFSS